MREAPADKVTLGWLLGNLRRRSFGIILLLLGACGLLPVVSPVAGLLLAYPAYQMIRARPVPMFPTTVAAREISTARLSAMLARIVPVLRYLERFIRPRWITPFETTKRIIGGFVLLLGICLLAPLPLSNIPIGLAIVLIAFAYLEEDGILLAGALIISLLLFAIVAATLWGAVSTIVWLSLR